MAIAPFTLSAPAKINLCLLITGRRADGYHDLQTAFQMLDICDTLSFKLSDQLTVESNIELPVQTNLVYLAAKLLQEFSATNQGATIYLDKLLPMGAGLGGGSSDAATTLLGLNRLWQLGIPVDALMQLGRQLGADVPVFVFAQSAWGEGIGEVLTPLVLAKSYYLVVSPGCHVDTGRIFSHPELTRDSSSITIARFLEHGARNDCENVVRQLYPEVDEALLWLNKWGPAKMTGTGSCVFLPFDSRLDAESVARQVPEQWTAFVAQGLDKSPVVSQLVQLG
ncbi:MAG: 4-(cytidine 5'-diphospho)-2-C-methyl-D-erythritol kinase [Pseudomonadales bacterium]|nr:4-(cytidine 5'-diphospho)-2-C-methyl-D-erythritol kinase [Pseudomonadales bacterium]MDG1441728.1 4-(cytidine 5'-diphospho)-2-C-methyl-D-erythritol kinase [Pseudomonadales bacterium]